MFLGSSFTKENSTDESSNIKWIAHPSSQTVKKGTTVIFTCSVSCNKQIKYHWKANNKTLQKASESRYILTPNGTLEIANAKVEDKGAYQCFVTTKDGTKTLGESVTAMLDVKGKIRNNKETTLGLGDFKEVKPVRIASISSAECRHSLQLDGFRGSDREGGGGGRGS